MSLHVECLQRCCDIVPRTACTQDDIPPLSYGISFLQCVVSHQLALVCAQIYNNVLQWKFILCLSHSHRVQCSVWVASRTVTFSIYVLMTHFFPYSAKMGYFSVSRRSTVSQWISRIEVKCGDTNVERWIRQLTFLPFISQVMCGAGCAFDVVQFAVSFSPTANRRLLNVMRGGPVCCAANILKYFFIVVEF